MGESSDDAAARLTDAIRALVKEAQSPTGTVSSEKAKPELSSAFFLLLLIINLLFVAASIPKEVWDNLHWDVLKEAIPFLGGSFFVVIASWYQDLTLKILQSRAFRSVNLLFTLCCLLFVVPWLRITPETMPKEASYLVDDDKRSLIAGKPLPLSLRPHTFKVRWHDGEERDFKMNALDVVKAEFDRGKPKWLCLYRVHFKAEGGPGIKLAILPAPGTAFDADFLRSDLQQHSLAPELDGSVTFSFDDNEENPKGSTTLPYGTYRVAPFQLGCKHGQARTTGPEQPLNVGPATPETSFAKLECQ